MADPNTLDGLIIDPCLDYDPVRGGVSTTSTERLVSQIDQRGLRLKWILETHAHADHLSSAHWLKQRYRDARLAIGSGIQEVQKAFKPIFNLDDTFNADGRQFDHLCRADETFLLGEIPVRVIASAGHTPDGVCYLIGDALFLGDTLFMPDSGAARCDFPRRGHLKCSNPLSGSSGFPMKRGRSSVHQLEAHEGRQPTARGPGRRPQC